MARTARSVAIGYPHHVVHKGIKGNKVFSDEMDYMFYLHMLKKYAEKWTCHVLAYCLMPDHVHLFVKPVQEASLSKTIQGVKLSYTQYINKKYNKTGKLWGGRYYSCIVDKENYLWTVARYIEQNPKRAGMVNIEEEYPYSSAKSHVNGVDDEVLGEEIFGDEGRREYIDFLHSPVTSQEIKEITHCTRTGLPFGNKTFVKILGQSLNLDLMKKPRGRPKKKPIIE